MGFSEEALATVEHDDFHVMQSNVMTVICCMYFILFPRSSVQFCDLKLGADLQDESFPARNSLIYVPILCFTIVLFSFVIHSWVLLFLAHFYLISYSKVLTMFLFKQQCQAKKSQRSNTI